MPRLIEVDFPLEQASLDSVHEKNVRHGHISTLHVWPARRPLAACRAALIATLLPDPGNIEERKAIYRRMAGMVKETVSQKKQNGKTVEKRKRETEGGILHWGRERSTEGRDALDWFNNKIREAYGGRAPKVLDPFAGGGAIPLEAMRLGCETTAIDINPVAWFILKCTLEYPQKLAGQTRPLSDFAMRDRDFMESFLKAQGNKGKALRQQLTKLGFGEDGLHAEPELIARSLDADLAWQVRAWGRRVLAEVRKGLAYRYPTYAEFSPLKPGGDPFEPRSLDLLEPDADGKTDATPLNAGFEKKYLDDSRNPRWVAKPTVAYLWARTVLCKGCRATIPLLKTKWLAKKDNKRVALIVTPNAERTGVVFDIEKDVPREGGNAAQQREYDQRRGGGTMSRSGAQCPCCTSIMSMADIRHEGQSGRLGSIMTAVVMNGPQGKEYRLPTAHEIEIAEVSEGELDELYAQIPFGLPGEALPGKEALGFRVPLYGFDQWGKLFTERQLLTLGTFVTVIRRLMVELADWPEPWREALIANLALVNDRLADYSSAICSWHNSGEKLRNTFGRFALPIVWDYTEVNPFSNTSGNFLGALEWVGRFISHRLEFSEVTELPTVKSDSATNIVGKYDAIITDPPYYDAIPYSDLMDFFYVWLRRSTHGLSSEIDAAFSESLGPKWDHDAADGELIDDASRFDGDKARSKQNYEDGMARAFEQCHAALQPEGRLVVVFANKSPDAWETLVAALIRSGFVVNGSWPIQTEMGNRTRAMSSAALSSSVWLVCKKRPPARPGWDATVLDKMRENVTHKLRTFWDAGIRGPDFVWAATGPALEAFSRYPTVKKADEAGEVMTVSEFLREVRRFVVDFVVGRVLTDDGNVEEISGLDDITTYYLLHRNDFGLDKAPVGACILYALSCNLADRDLTGRYDLLVRAKGSFAEDTLEAEDDEGAGDGQTGSGNKVRLKAWSRRKAKKLGYEGASGQPAPLIDKVHRLMHLWRGGDEARVNQYIDAGGLASDRLFGQLLQALIELAPEGSEERALLESLSNHMTGRRGMISARQTQTELQLGETL